MGSLQSVIDQKNRETAADRRRLFGKKANDQQHHANLVKHVEVALEAFSACQSTYITGCMDNNLKAAMRELKSALMLSKKRLDQ